MLTLASQANDLVTPIAVGGSFVLVITLCIAATVRSILATKHREETKRELAAYVAEGSITPEDAARILQTDQPSEEAEHTKRELAEQVARGKLSAADAERILKADLPAWHKGEGASPARP